MSEQITHYTPCCATCRHAEAGGPCAWRHDNADGDCCPDWEYGNHAAWLGDDTPYPMASREITAEPHGSMEEHTALCEHTRVESLPDRRKQLPHHVMVLHSQKGLLAAAALAYRYGKELHPAGTAAKLQELAKERDEPEHIGYSLRALLGLAWEYVHDARAGSSFLDAARAEGLLVGTYGGRQPTDLGRKTWTDFLRRLGLPGDGSKPEPEPEPTLTESADGRREWWLNGKLHREDGPAIEWPDGRREWWLHGKRHRDDGPAIAWPDGYRSWWLHGKRQPEPDKGGRQ